MSSKMFHVFPLKKIPRKVPMHAMYCMYFIPVCLFGSQITQKLQDRFESGADWVKLDVVLVMGLFVFGGGKTIISLFSTIKGKYHTFIWFEFKPIYIKVILDWIHIMSLGLVVVQSYISLGETM